MISVCFFLYKFQIEILRYRDTLDCTDIRIIVDSGKKGHTSYARKYVKKWQNDCFCFLVEEFEQPSLLTMCFHKIFHLCLGKKIKF